MQGNLTVNIREVFGKWFSDRCTQGDRCIQGRYIQVRLYRGPYFILARLGTSLQQNDADAVALCLSR